MSTGHAKHTAYSAYIIPKILNLKSQLFMSLNIHYGEEKIYVNYFL